MHDAFPDAKLLPGVQLPLYEAERGTHLVALGGALLMDVVAEVSAVPEDDVLIFDQLSVDELIQIGGCADSGTTVVELVAVVAQDPGAWRYGQGVNGCALGGLCSTIGWFGRREVA